MPIHKVTNFLSEISFFFKKSDANNAMYTIMNVIKGVIMTEKKLFGITSKLQNTDITDGQRAERAIRYGGQ